MKSLLFSKNIFFILIQIPLILFAANKRYGHGRLFTTNGSIVLFTQAEIKSDSIYYYSESSQLKKQPLQEIAKIEIQNGNEAITFTAIGTLSGFLGSYAGTSGLDEDINIRSTFYLGGAALGGLIGFMMGVNAKTYLTVYSNPSYR